MGSRRRECPSIWLYEVKTKNEYGRLHYFYLMAASEDIAKITACKVSRLEDILGINKLGHSMSDFDEEALEELEKWKPKPLRELVVQKPQAPKMKNEPLHGIVAQNPSTQPFSPVLGVIGIVDQGTYLYDCEILANFAEGITGGRSKTISFFVVAKDIAEAASICEHSHYIGHDCGRYWRLRSIKVLGFSYLKSTLLALS